MLGTNFQFTYQLARNVQGRIAGAFTEDANGGTKPGFAVVSVPRCLNPENGFDYTFATASHFPTLHGATRMLILNEFQDPSAMRFIVGYDGEIMAPRKLAFIVQREKEHAQLLLDACGAFQYLMKLEVE